MATRTCRPFGMHARLGAETGIWHQEASLPLTYAWFHVEPFIAQAQFDCKVSRARRILKRASESKLKKLQSLRERLQALNVEDCDGDEEDDEARFEEGGRFCLFAPNRVWLQSVALPPVGVQEGRLMSHKTLVCNPPVSKRCQLHVGHRHKRCPAFFLSQERKGNPCFTEPLSARFATVVQSHKTSAVTQKRSN